MPKIGTRPRSPRTDSIRYGTPSGSPGPLERKTPSGFRARTSAAGVDAGTTVTSHAAARSWRRMLSLIPQSYATTLNRGAGGATKPRESSHVPSDHVYGAADVTSGNRAPP